VLPSPDDAEDGVWIRCNLSKESECARDSLSRAHVGAQYEYTRARTGIDHERGVRTVAVSGACEMKWLFAVELARDDGGAFANRPATTSSIARISPHPPPTRNSVEETCTRNDNIDTNAPDLAHTSTARKPTTEQCSLSTLHRNVYLKLWSTTNECTLP
jgi:hypothetical protein